MPKSKSVTQTTNAASQATNAATTYNSLLLQNGYNPYVQHTYVHLSLDDWQLEHNYCINGDWMNLEGFVNYIYPEDCAEKTYLILKLKEQKNAD